MKLALLALASFAVFAIATPIAPRADSGTVIDQFMSLTAQSMFLTESVNNITPGPVSVLFPLSPAGEVLERLQNILNTASETAKDVVSEPQMVFSANGAEGTFDSVAGYVPVLLKLLESLIGKQKDIDFFFSRPSIASKLTRLQKFFVDIHDGLIPLIPTQAAATGAQFMQIDRSLTAAVDTLTQWAGPIAVPIVSL